jgi:hypothetical protein
MQKIGKILRIIFNALTHSSLLTILFRDMFRRSGSAKSDKEHLIGAIDWMRRSQDAAVGGGCAGIYTFSDGWTPPYPETTGYIIPTFLWYGELTNITEYLERATRMGDWELDIQLESGAVRGGVGINEYPIVFNTGQVMLGWVSLFDKTGIVKYQKAAERAAEWLVGNQDKDGNWSKNTYNGVPHSYNLRVAWAMMEVSRITGKNQFNQAAEKNLKWVLSKSKSNGWIDFMGFTLEEKPFTHTIAYTLSGLLECSFFLKGELKEQVLELVNKGSDHILATYESLNANAGSKSRFLPGRFNNEWVADESFSCLTGNAQMAIIWLKLYKINRDKRLLNAAVKNLEQLKSTQNMTSKNDGIRGGIAGSFPIWGDYVNFGYPNWAAKFFADALMLKGEILESEEK